MTQTPEPRDGGLVLLKWLVIGLTATMMAGFVVLIVLFVTRFPDAAPPLPEAIDLPDGTRATAFTRGRDFLAVVTAEDTILIYDPQGRELRQTIHLD